jgi:hypothetical protein
MWLAAYIHQSPNAHYAPLMDLWHASIKVENESYPEKNGTTYPVSSAETN